MYDGVVRLGDTSFGGCDGEVMEFGSIYGGVFLDACHLHVLVGCLVASCEVYARGRAMMN